MRRTTGCPPSDQAPARGEERPRPRCRFRPILAAGLTSLLLGVLGIGLSASPAHAVLHGLPDHFCLYEHTDFRGDGRCFTATDVRNVVNMSSHNFDDIASSVVNNLGFTVCFSVSENGQGGSSTLGAYRYLRDLTRNASPNGGTWNDKISSLTVTPCRS